VVVPVATINARSDTVATKPAFRSAFKKRRCLVLADGYVEWEKSGKDKLPWLYEVDRRIRVPLFFDFFSTRAQSGLLS